VKLGVKVVTSAGLNNKYSIILGLVGVSIEAMTQIPMVIVIVFHLIFPLLGVLIITSILYVPACELTVPAIVSMSTDRVINTGRPDWPSWMTLVRAVVSLQGVSPY